MMTNPVAFLLTSTQLSLDDPMLTKHAKTKTLLDEDHYGQGLTDHRLPFNAYHNNRM